MHIIDHNLVPSVPNLSVVQEVYDANIPVLIEDLHIIEQQLSDIQTGTAMIYWILLAFCIIFFVYMIYKLFWNVFGIKNL